MIDIEMKEHGFSMQTEFGELSISRDVEHGFRPFELLVASMAGCSSTALKVVLTKMRIDFSGMKVLVNVERNEVKANRIEKVNLHFIIQGEDLLQEKIEKAGTIARKHCAIIQSVKDSIQVTESFEIGS